MMALVKNQNKRDSRPKWQEFRVNNTFEHKEDCTLQAWRKRYRDGEKKGKKGEKEKE